MALTVTQAQRTSSFTVSKSGKGKQNIILIPGFACSAQVWDETTTTALKGKTCYALSFAGFAGVPAQAEPDIKTWENDIIDFIQVNKIDNPVLIGHSLGGVMALDIASSKPGLISKIIVVDALPSLARMYNPAFKHNDNPDCTPVVKQFEDMDSTAFVTRQKATFAFMLADTSKLNMVLNWSMQSDRKTMGKTYCQLMNTDLRSSLKSITCPSLIMLEPSFKAKDAEIKQQYQALQTADLRYATSGLHFIMYDDKEWYMNTIETFLR